MIDLQLASAVRRTVWLGSCFWALALLLGCGSATHQPITPPPPPPPSGLSISGLMVSNVTTTSASVSWTTNIPATSQVQYGTSTSYGSSTPLDSTPVTSHSAQLVGLAAGTAYYLQVNSAASSGASASQASSFSTLTNNPPPPPPSGNGVAISNISGSTEINRFVSVPRFFRQGDIPQFAQAVVNGAGILTQCDVKNRWPDGSLKFAIISFILPNLSQAGTQVSFQNQATGNNTGGLVQTDMLDPAYDFDGVIQISGSASHNISARTMLQAGKFRYWLQGPIVTAVIIEDRDNRSFDVNVDNGAGNPLHPMFEAWFYPQGHKVELGFTLENTWASSSPTNSARNQTFSLVLTTGSASPSTQLTQASFTQWAFTRWRRAYWIGGAPAAIGYNWNPQYLLSTKAYPHWDTNYLPSPQAISDEYSTYTYIATNFPARLTIPGYDNATNGGIVNYDEAIDATGDNPHGSWIGLAPTWDANYLLSGDNNLRQMMIDNADLVGRFPMWFREADHNAGSGHFFDRPVSGNVDPYGHVVSINARQQVTLYLANWHPGCNGEAPDNVNAGSALSYSNWPPMDTSHLPDFGYIPYTLTGKYYYLEQVYMEAGYIIGGGTGCFDLTNNYYRQGYLGLIESYVRDTAWYLRAIAYAAFIAPDGDPEGPYFKDKLLNNIALQEGQHGLTLDITDTGDRSVAYNWGKTTAQSTQANNPSPLGAWQIDGASQSYAQNGSVNNVNAAKLSNAGSMFQEHFLSVSLGMIRQLGLADTKPLLSIVAKRYFHILADPSVNHYLIEQYVYPSQLTNGSWVADWNSFQGDYLVLPTGWCTPDQACSAYGVQAVAATSFMTDITVDGYSGQAVWTWFKANKPNQDAFSTIDPRWSLTPLQ